MHKFNEKIDNYFEEYLTLILDFPEKQSIEIQHRRKMLREWLDNEIQLWENTKDLESQQSTDKDLKAVA